MATQTHSGGPVQVAATANAVKIWAASPTGALLRSVLRVPRTTHITLKVPTLVAGISSRRAVRAALDAARVLGADVRHTEHKGLLDSVFTIRAEGTRDELDPMLRLLAVAAGAAR